MAQKVRDPLPRSVPVAQGLVGSIGDSVAQVDGCDHVQYAHHQHPGQPYAALATTDQTAKFQNCSYGKRNLRQERDHDKRREGILAETRETVGAERATAGANFARGGADEFYACGDGFAENGGHGWMIFVFSLCCTGFVFRTFTGLLKKI